MSYELTKSQNLKQSTYERLAADSGSIQNMVSSWRNTYISLRSQGTPAENVDLDARKDELVQALNTLLGN